MLFHPVLLLDLITARHENALLLAYPKANQPLFSDEEMKVPCEVSKRTLRLASSTTRPVIPARELAEHRRILAEEYRLLRARHADAPRARQSRCGFPRRRSPGRFDAEATQGFWNRVKRVMLGISTVEGS